MIKVIIIEDEKYAANFMRDLLLSIAPDVSVIGILENTVEAIKHLPALDPDLVLADIQLEDGLSFAIFEKLNWTKPVIFITAYDSYAIKAFKLNSIDYILKPCDADELKQALNKYRNGLMQHSVVQFEETLKILLQQSKKEFKERFAVVIGSRILSIPVSDVSYFFYMNRVTYLVKKDGQKFPYAESMDRLYHILSPSLFFRINRNYIIQHHAIDKIQNHAGRTIILNLIPVPAEGSIAVSKDRISEFKCWLDN